MEINKIKIILIGSYAVGKSCVINALMKKEFGNTSPTIGLQFQTCKIKNKNNIEYILSIFDTAGEERYKSFISMYFQK
jgi:small GTP-binding protein